MQEEGERLGVRLLATQFEVPHNGLLEVSVVFHLCSGGSLFALYWVNAFFDSLLHETAFIVRDKLTGFFLALTSFPHW